MGLISSIYRKQFVCRYDKAVGVPYHSLSDYEGMKMESGTFLNSNGIEIHYFNYHFDNYKKDKIVLFLHGIGPGHTAYLAEINEICKRGYKVLTLDYQGCGESKGERLNSMLEPTKDVNDLLNHLNLKEEIILVGHSLGGFTALNIINQRSEIKKAVILSGFLSVSFLVETFVKSRFISSRIIKYEKKQEPIYFGLDNLYYLKNTNDKLFFIQSEDDPIVSYLTSLKVVESIENPNIKTLRVNNRAHNPNYTDDAAKYLNETFGEFNLLVKQKKIKTDEEKIEFFKKVSLERLTAQDEKMFDEIINFIK